MKTLLWIIIIAALIFGGIKLYRHYSAKPEETKTGNATQPPKPEPTTAAKPNSEKGIENWRPVKRVLNLSDQHNKDLENNLK
ncbi:MAG: hypothetical protein PHH77_01395 [Victivallaceae bacterium]|nr:hypothetical protein [Victivallaceae bacterium]